MHTKRILRFLLLVALLVPICSELALRIVVGHSVSASTPESFPRKRSEPYANSPYWNETFWREQREANSTWQMADDSGIYASNGYRGTYVNIQDGRRVTTDQSPSAAHTLWFVGSSNAEGISVPDAYTIASYLQRMVGRRYRVENLSVASIDARKELILLKRQPIKPGDIVVMYDGMMDMLSVYWTASKQQTYRPGLCRWLIENASWSYLVRFACYSPTAVVNSALATEGERRYSAAIIEAHDYYTARGVQFFHFIEPTLYSMGFNAYEQTIHSDLVNANIADAYAVTWPMLQTVPYTTDLTHVLDPLRSSGAAIYFDHVHTNETGNAAIARAIADVLMPTF